MSQEPTEARFAVAHESNGAHHRTRSDAFTFYALVAVSFLESTAGTYVENLAPLFGDDPRVSHWLKTVWWPEEVMHGELAKGYIRSIWPEFDWAGGYEVFLEHYVPRCDSGLLRPSPGLEALARCVTETQATMIYRCIGSYTGDPPLQALMKRLSTDEVRHYAYFRDIFDRHERTASNSLWRKARTVVGRSKLVRDEDIALAFRPLNACWRSQMPFEPMTYQEFLAAAGLVMREHFPFEQAKRMLFRPLRTGARLENVVVDLLATILRRQYPHVH
jgi:hypothetical protein